MTAANTQTIFLTADRDSVCAGDDCESHERSFAAPLGALMPELIQRATSACPLARIAGGQATWIVEAGGYDRTPIAVMAQQWAAPRWLVSSSSRVERLFANRQARLFFKYWCQADPDAVFEALASNKPLPSRHG